jgi:MscS family membrane protein
MQIALLILFVLVLNFILKKVLLRLHQRFKTEESSWKDSEALALISPLASLIWILAAVYGINFLWEKLFGSSVFDNVHAVVKIGLILATSWFLLRWKKFVITKLQKQNSTGDHPEDYRKIDAINKVVTLSIFVIAILLLLEQTGTSANSLIALGGIGGLALAFASQQLFSNFFGGIMLYFTQPFGIGDWIQLPEKNLEGHVEEIGWYTTQIRTLDKRPLYIPNSMLANALVINPSRMTHRQFKSMISLRYQDISQLPQVVQDIQKLLFSFPGIDQTISPQVHFTAFGNNGLDILITAFAVDMERTAFAELTQALLYGIAAILEKHGADFAAPTPIFPSPKGIT